MSFQPSLVPDVRSAAAKRGIARLTRELKTNRNALGSYLAGTARPGTVLLIETRFRELLQRESTQKAPAQQVRP